MQSQSNTLVTPRKGFLVQLLKFYFIHLQYPTVLHIFSSFPSQCSKRMVLRHIRMDMEKLIRSLNPGVTLGSVVRYSQENLVLRWSLWQFKKLLKLISKYNFTSTNFTLDWKFGTLLEDLILYSKAFSNKLSITLPFQNIDD